MARKYFEEEFKKKVKEIHGNNLDLSEYTYTRSIDSSKCICKVCGNVWYPRADVLLRGCGCRKCHDKKISDKKKMSYDEIMERIHQYHPNIILDKENYINTKHRCKAKCEVCGYEWNAIVGDLVFKHTNCPKCANQFHNKEEKMKNLWQRVNFVNETLNYEIIDIELDNKNIYVHFICPKHGKQIENLKWFLSGKGCKICLGEQNKLLKGQKVLERVKQILGDKYDYSKFNYIDAYTKVTLICPHHGEFQKYVTDIWNGEGCYQCAMERRLTQIKVSKEEWVEKCKEVHKGKYDYSLVNFNKLGDEVEIICPVHGSYICSSKNHYYGYGICPQCNLRKKLTQTDFIERSKKIHNNKYNYSKVEYIGYTTAVVIVCPEHGEYWQKPSDHLDGCGCPICRESHLEREIRTALELNSVDLIAQHKFDWLGQQSLDFYLPQYNIAIECQGSQHFIDTKLFKDTVEGNKKRDKRKRTLCQENNVELIYYLNTKYNEYVKDLDIPYFNTTDELINYIKKKEGYESSI